MRRVLLTLAAAALTLAGCAPGSPAASDAGHHAKPPACATRTAKTAPSDYYTYARQFNPQINAAAFGRYFPGARALPPGQALLTGPHSAFQVTSVATVTQLSGAAACALNLPRPQKAAPGRQLLAGLVNFNMTGWLLECQLQANVPACLNYPQPQIVIGGGKPRVYPAANLFVVSVLDRAPVWLQMNDGGRSQDINLRTGQRARVATSPYYRGRQEFMGTLELMTSWNALNLPGLKWFGNDILASLNHGAAALTPYLDDRKWAPPGRAWLIMNWNMSSQWKTVLNVPRSFSLTLPGGLKIHPTGTGTANTGTGSGPGNVYLVFAVPATTRTATLTWTPTGTTYPPHLAAGHLPPAPPARPWSPYGHWYGTSKIAIRLGP